MEGTGGVGGITPGIAARSAGTAGWAGAMARSFGAALARPRWWALALAAFLVRGGALLIVLPIMTLPTVATLTSLGAPVVVAMAFGNPPLEMVTAAVVAVGLVAGWLVLAAVLGSWLDLALVEEAALEEDLELGRLGPQATLRRAVAARLLPHLATLVVAGYAAVRLVLEGYSEILAPGDQSIPLAWRIALRVPDAIIGLAGTWLVAEGLGGLALRRVAVGEPALRALASAAHRLVRPSGAATLLLTSAAVAAMLTPFWFAAARTWEQARILLVDDAPAPLVVAAVLLLVVTVGLGLALLAAGLAWRSVAWTAEAYRTGPAPAPQPAAAEAATI